MKKYITKGNQVFKVELNYNLGGYSYVTGKQQPRGYYFSVSPVGIKEKDGYRVETYKAYTGFKEVLLEVKRKSNKKYEEALSMLTDEKIEERIQYVIDKNNITI